MAVKQEIKYKVRKIDGTDAVEGTISLNVKKQVLVIWYTELLLHNQTKKDKELPLQKLVVKLLEEEKSLGSRKALEMLDLDLAILPYGLEVEYHLVQNQDHIEHKINIKERRLAITTALHYNFEKVTVVDSLSQDIDKINTKSAIKT